MKAWEEADNYFFPEMEDERTCDCEYGDCITADMEEYF